MGEGFRAQGFRGFGVLGSCWMLGKIHLRLAPLVVRRACVPAILGFDRCDLGVI